MSLLPDNFTLSLTQKPLPAALPTPQKTIYVTSTHVSTLSSFAPQELLSSTDYGNEEIRHAIGEAYLASLKPVLSPGVVGVKPLPSLVGIRNSVTAQKLRSDRHNSPRLQEKPSEICPNGRYLLGKCGHAKRWLWVPCKKRSCKVCGPAGRAKMAERIAWGVGLTGSVAFMVLTFKPDDKRSTEPQLKALANKKLNHFIEKLRQDIPDLQYVKTFELTAKGRLHVNLIVTPWKYVHQTKLQKMWGARIWIERISGEETIAAEMTKTGKRRLDLAEYMAKVKKKVEQVVPVEWGRRVAFSKKWPKLPEREVQRVGVITWVQFGHEYDADLLAFLSHKDLKGIDALASGLSPFGEWVEARPGEFAKVEDLSVCDCWKFIDSGPTRALKVSQN